MILIIINYQINEYTMNLTHVNRKCTVTLGYSSDRSPLSLKSHHPIVVNEIASVTSLVCPQTVLKWLHQLSRKKVMLLHAVVERLHETRHCARVPPFPGELDRYTSPLPESHALPPPARAQPTGPFADWNLIVVAPAASTSFAHVVLKWLHHLLAYKVTLCIGGTPCKM